MNQRLSLIFVSLLLITVLSSCAPAPGGPPSPALREQLQQLKTQQQQQDEQLRALQQQLSHIEKALGIEPAVVETPAPAVFPELTVPHLPTPSYTQRPEYQTSETTAYLAAFNHLAGARYAAAEAGFENFLNQYPNHQQAPDARFRLAGAQISQGKYDLAASHLRRLITDPNAQSRTPAAMLQLAQLYRQQGRSTESEAMLQQLRERYPASPEAQNTLPNSIN